jgi:hypothetical protein
MTGNGAGVDVYSNGDTVLADNLIRAGQVACRYSWRMPVLVENSATSTGLLSSFSPISVDQPGKPGSALDPDGRDREGDNVWVVVRWAQAHAVALVDTRV